ncbi:Multiple epidermal growth factor-like domains protein 10 [Portunus trituberculatus]|uniref:Multiple epidermal growth factor-like domains protein 10 n=1 Tax=Portunus trituberculatus TaxID=210409 RepID=A0A5B7K2B6_PORTR|nr:Multiple epidermal growth factor-like domains protein 10 [Portunus trituberculatus]
MNHLPHLTQHGASFTVCSDGHWGDECREKCQCEGSSLCDPVSGDCFCPAGLRGRKCRWNCLKGRYGVDCKQVRRGGGRGEREGKGWAQGCRDQRKNYLVKLTEIGFVHLRRGSEDGILY